MRKIFLALVITVCGLHIHAQDSLNTMEELRQLLKQRKDQFETYAQQADQQSGIFGNKTKKDLEKSREILLQIVNIDNRIMDELNRAISSRGMAKADYSTDEVQYQQTIQQLTLAADTLEKQLDKEKLVRASFEKQSKLLQIGLILLFVIAGVVSYLFFFRRRI